METWREGLFQLCWQQHGGSDLAAAGFNVTESVRLLNPVLDLAAGSLGQLTPSQAAGLASQAMKAFGLSIDEASISVDRMLHLHRLVVDELHSQLVKKGRVVERLVGKVEQIVTKPIATEVRARFFDKGLKLPARAVEELQGKEPGQ